MDPISKVFYRNFTLVNCNHMYPSALELQNRQWITHGRRIQLIDKPNDMPNYRVNVNWSTSAPMDRFFNDKVLELGKTAQRLRHLRKTITGREVLLGQGGLYEHETLEYFNTDLKCNHHWHELLFFEYLNREVKHIWQVACTNDRTKNWRLLLLSTRVVRGNVDSQAPNVSNCCSNLK